MPVATALNVRERLQALLRFQPLDRLPMVEWATWWNQTVDRWTSEGLPVRDRYEMYRHFGLDDWRQHWFGPMGPDCPRPASHGAGIVTDLDSYLAVRPLLFGPPDLTPLLGWRDQHDRGEVGIWFTMTGFFWFPRELLGIERHLYAFYDQPELLHRILDDQAAWMLRVLSAMGTAGLRPDFMTFAEDMSYNHGPMLSEALFDEFLLPYYHRVVPAIRELGTVPIIDSDGDISRALPWFERAGLAGILPLERQAGVDVAALRRAHPRQVLIGAYDKMVMPHGEAAMRAEFERLVPTARQGGFAISVDHQTPPGVSLEQYQTFVRLFREYAVLGAG